MDIRLTQSDLRAPSQPTSGKRRLSKAVEGKHDPCYCGQALRTRSRPRRRQPPESDAETLQEAACQRPASSRVSIRSKTSRRSSTFGSRRSTRWYAVASFPRSSSAAGESGGSTASSSRTTSSECTRRHGSGRSRIHSPGVRKKRDDRDRGEGQEAPSGERCLTTGLSQVMLHDLEVVVPDDLDRSRGLVAIGELQTHRRSTTGEFA